MKRFLIVCFVAIGMASCSNYSIDIYQLEGFWEIDEVILNNDTKKDYTVNTIIDYYEITSDSTGIKRKVNASLDGTFEGSKDFETFKINKNKDGYTISYSTSIMNYEEEIVKLNQDQLIILNQNSNRYIYKRYKPLTLE